MPSALNSGTAAEMGPCELADMSIEPVRRPVMLAASSPSVALPATWTSIRPPLFSAAQAAKCFEPSSFGLPGAALWLSVSLTSWPSAGATAAIVSRPANINPEIFILPLPD